MSFPKNKIKILLLENIHPHAQQVFRQEGYQVEVVNKSLSEEALADKIRDVFLLGIRSKTQISSKAIEQANKLLAIGAFCIGTNQVDKTACQDKGIVVFNAPYSNTRSVVELTAGLMIMLLRNIFDKSVKLHQGIWDKSAKNSFEIRGKKLGIVGYGNIGSQLSVLAEAMGMEVYYYDAAEKLSLGNARKCESLKELLRTAEIISLHVDGNSKNKNLIGEQEFKCMKEGVILINLSRGFVVDIGALAHFVKAGKVKGAAVDVFPYEPLSNDEKFITELQGLPNVILTPHIGGSTEEAQKNIAAFVPRNMINFINNGNVNASVNFPEIQLPELNNAHRLIHIHENIAGMMARITGVFARHKINIVGQYLKTSEKMGYVITDMEKNYDRKLIQELKDIPHTIKLRVLY